ncbi:MAG: hypothetical protein ABEJ34_06550 [Haloferacaceae archaeon]
MTDVGLPARAYRGLDAASKLLGVGLIAVGLDVGGDTATGVALALAGAALGTLTVFIDNHD